MFSVLTASSVFIIGEMIFFISEPELLYCPYFNYKRSFSVTELARLLYFNLVARLFYGHTFMALFVICEI